MKLESWEWNRYNEIIMQGEIGVESAIGVGTTFTVKIRRSENGLEETR